MSTACTVVRTASKNVEVPRDDKGGFLLSTLKGRTALCLCCYFNLPENKSRERRSCFLISLPVRVIKCEICGKECVHPEDSA